MRDGRQRIVAGTAASLTWQPVDADGEPAAPADTVTVGVTRADGTELLPAGTATSGTDSDPRTVALTAAQTATLDWLTATWTVDGVAVATTTHETVGGVYMTTAAIRAAEPSLTDSAKWPAAKLIAARERTERAFEAECHRAFVPRFAVLELRQCSLLRTLPITDVRDVRWVEDEDGDAVNFEHYGSARTLVAYHPGPVTVGVEYGYDAPPSDLLEKFAKCVRHSLNAANSGLPDRAMSFQPAEGGSVTLATAGLGPWIYGIPDVDQVIHRHKWRGWKVR